MLFRRTEARAHQTSAYFYCPFIPVSDGGAADSSACACACACGLVGVLHCVPTKPILSYPFR